MADATAAIYSAEVATARIMAKMRLQLFEKSLGASGLRRAFAEADISGEPSCQSADTVPTGIHFAKVVGIRFYVHAMLAASGNGVVCGPVWTWHELQRSPTCSCPRLLARAGDGALDPEELDEALRYVGLFLDTRELHALQRTLDTDGSGRVCIHELMDALMETGSTRRMVHATKIWKAISGGRSAVGPADVLTAFRADKHVDVTAGRKRADDVAGGLAEELAACSPEADGDKLEESHVVRAILQWGVAFPSDDMFCGQVEDCFGVPEGSLGREDSAALKTQMVVVRAKAVEKKPQSQGLRLFLTGICRHFDGSDCGGLTAGEFSRVLERLGLPLPPPKVAVLFRAFGGAKGVVKAGDREPRLPWKGFVEAVTEGQTA